MAIFPSLGPFLAWAPLKVLDPRGDKGPYFCLRKALVNGFGKEPVEDFKHTATAGRFGQFGFRLGDEDPRPGRL